MEKNISLNFRIKKLNKIFKLNLAKNPTGL